MIFLNSLLLLICFSFCTNLFAADSTIEPKNVAVIVNTSNTNSVTIGKYYVKIHDIPKHNLIRVNIENNATKLTLAQFSQLQTQINAKLDANIEVILLVWTAPYAVECNSITAALTMGYDADQCINTCHVGKQSKYYDSTNMRPSALGLRLSMLMPTESVANAKKLIQRGVLSGLQLKQANAYYLITSDRQRSTRAEFFPKSRYLVEKKLQINTLVADSIVHKKDIMIYQTGAISVPSLDTLVFLPGALADHLTSTGGDLLNGAQMSNLKWLDAGATASYGTVSEPCNYWQKFSNPSVLLTHYLSGETAIESYWKSVAWPAQGLFIGDPMAAPYCRYCQLR